MVNVTVISDNDLVSAHFLRAEKLVTVDTATNNKIEEKITATKGVALVNRINQMMPDALILATGGPALNYLNKSIEVYQAAANTTIDDAVDMYKQNQLQKYTMPPAGSGYGPGKGGGGKGKGGGSGGTP
jgi:predicted Fe-Mo cluster-binding NifX family protein